MHFFISICIIMLLCLCFACDINSVLRAAQLSLIILYRWSACDSLYPQGFHFELEYSVSVMFA